MTEHPALSHPDKEQSDTNITGKYAAAQSDCINVDTR